MTEGQSKKLSFVESFTSTALGIANGILGQIFIFPLVGIEANLNQHLVIGICFAVIALTKNIVVRRFFNWIESRRGRSHPE